MARIPYTYFEPHKIARLRRLNLVAKAAVEGFISGLHRSPHRGFSVEFTEHREYAPGDDVRHLDWVAWGRSDRYYIKQYEQETNLRAHILLDASASMNYRHGAPLTKFAYGAFLAACLSYLMCRQQDAVGMIAFDEAVRFHLRPSSTPAHLDRLFKRLEMLRPGRRTALAETFHQLAERIAKRGLVVVISDLYEDQDEIVRALQHFVAKKHQIILFHMLDPAELELPFERLQTFVDMETGARILANAGQIREAYQSEVNAFIERYRRECSERSIEYVIARTDEPYDRMLLRYLERRRAVLR